MNGPGAKAEVRGLGSALLSILRDFARRARLAAEAK